MIFEARADQIASLSSEQLAMLMKRLLLAECRKVGIPLRSATVPLQITMADGGEDGRVSWKSGVASTDFFPSRFSVFQSKAQNLTESAMTAEIAKQRGKRPPLLNEAVAEVIRRKGAYIVFCSRAFTGRRSRDSARQLPLQSGIAELLFLGTSSATSMTQIELPTGSTLIHRQRYG